MSNFERYGDIRPPVSDEWGHLVSIHAEMGMAGRSFDGLIPFPFVEIEAWSRLARLPLEPFECQMIRSMSAAYAGMASDKNADCPIQTVEAQSAISHANTAALMSLARKVD